MYSSVVFPPLLLPLLLSLSLDPLKLLWLEYSSMALFTLSLDEERTIDILWKVYRQTKDEVRNIPGSRTRETYGRGILLDEALRRE